ASSSSEKLLKGDSLEITIIIYDGRSGKTQILASHNVKAKQEDLKLAETKPDQARANINLTALERTNELMSALGKEINPNKPIETKKEEKAVSSEKKEEKAEEPLRPLDDWLVSKVKVGLGPLVVGFVTFLFFVL
ncbi:MAG: hypothetical protein N3A69_04800, partial [Leptospiraceae bacterium]|nr:hypothetical protein [Leptospiraceae bacterium]